MRAVASASSLLVACLAFLAQQRTAAFSARPVASRHRGGRWHGATTVEPPAREKTDTDRSTEQRRRRQRRRSRDDDDGSADAEDGDHRGDLEYLVDSAESREREDPFHILLLGSTFEKPKITVPYVAGSLEYVLNMPFGEGEELSAFARDQGMSCLGTWPREECLTLGKRLQLRDIVCRVVPFCAGGQRGWQAKDAGTSDASSFR